MTSDEFLDEASVFHYWSVNGASQTIGLDPGSLAFTYCQVPVVAHRGGPQQIVITRADGSEQLIRGNKLDADTSQDIFQRTGIIQRLDVSFAVPPDTSVQ